MARLEDTIKQLDKTILLKYLSLKINGNHGLILSQKSYDRFAKEIEDLRAVKRDNERLIKKIGELKR